MEEARRLGEKYAPVDMMQGEIDRINRKKELAQLQAEETLPKRRAKLKKIYTWLDNNDLPEDMQNAVKLSLKLAKENLMNVDMFETYISAIRNLLRDLPNNPFMRTRSQTSLIDRAKKANREDPRMGSGRR